MKLIFATRPSALALWQTRWVMAALQQAHPNLECEEKIITTQGDKILDKPLPEIGGKGLFTQELEHELLSGAVHCAVHSLKDLPVQNLAGLTVGCIPPRAEVRDALVCSPKAGGAAGLQRPYHGIMNLPANALVGTSSPRRAAQLLAHRPDLKIQSLRGNVDTRLRKALEGQYDAIVLAGAGLTRLGLAENVTEWLPLELMLPAPGQGALAIQCRADDQSTLSLLAALEDESTRRAVTAERAFLSGLGGGCAVPVAAHAECRMINDEYSISLTGLVISLDGRKAVRLLGVGTDAENIGNELAQQALAEGAKEILHAVREEQG